MAHDGTGKPSFKVGSLMACACLILVGALGATLAAYWLQNAAARKDRLADEKEAARLAALKDPAGYLPPRGYVCHRAAGPIAIDRKLDEAASEALPCTAHFADIDF